MVIQDRIEQILQQGVIDGHFPGAHYAVVKGTEILVKGFVGNKQLYPEIVPLQGDEIYDVASLTKVISTTTMIMKLIEQGRLQLDTCVHEVIPWFIHKNITIAHLLTHTSGLPADIPKANQLRDRSDVENYIYSVGLINPVGSTIVYSDIGFILLGWIIEMKTKKPLPEVAKEWMFDPLGMTDTSYAPPKERCSPTELRQDHIYNGFLQGRVHDEKAFALQGEAGHAGLFSTTTDIALFLIEWLHPTNKVLSSKTIDSFFVTRQEGISKYNNPLKRAYGFDRPTQGGTAGQYIDMENTIVHTGFTGCNLWMDRTHDVAFVMLSNAVHPKRELNGIIPYRRNIADAIMESIKEDTNEKTT
jgi:CubicO group peptidase (beta-lactamase class C family)